MSQAPPQFAGDSVLTNDEHATGLHSDPFRKARPFAELVRENLAVGVGDCDRDRADWVMLVGRPSAVEAVAIRLEKPPHVLFESIVDAVTHDIFPMFASSSIWHDRKPP
jgi:hypothetical protein